MSALTLPASGLSPRLRGNRRVRGELIPDNGSIPAPAGEPSPVLQRLWDSGVYPRACGGTADRAASRSLFAGLSPRLRGNRKSPRCRGALSGSIPAPAGEPKRRYSERAQSRVYPRACGGTARTAAESACLRGLSPRLRGNLIPRRITIKISGSIPAPAGEPKIAVNSREHVRVYPRACGGTSRA